ncbi:MAG: hypothetical protein V7668_18215 [Cereibacter changlensis]|jgi:hypothetical protein|uniref:Arginine transporter n=2 Tax=Cereibacter changlensis TaxID=402884 RepID=A0A2T4JXX2_9RHOB|nr:hypothetical protein [Cereibacter changlensis]MBZ4690618.1 hypothetical protein [Cereibacter sp.]PTE22769.1 hypothetical protein C5F48_05315 [Cereibacter changlensis JA139]PZX52370.1 hypothetical protein LX76_02899 [Cereibacter changlensis]TKA96861.1 hypothetical protein FAZ78_09070 [Cereibacter changlensis]
MKTLTRAAALALFALPISSTFASAGPIDSACMRAGNGANRATCGCIQQVADMTLRGGDQRRAAKFFLNPDQAQETRVSKRDSDNAFWARYKQFGEAAQAYCG